MVHSTRNKFGKMGISVFMFLCFGTGIHPQSPSKDPLSPPFAKTRIITPKLILERSKNEEGKSYVGIRDITVDESSALYAFDYMNYNDP